MTEQTSIDSLEFARKSLEIRATIAVFDFSRLKDVLFSPKGELQYSLTGSRDAQGESRLMLQVRGELDLVCQRCLGSLPYIVDTTSEFVVVRDETDLPEPEDERDEVEYLVADTQLDVKTLIEDEVLLSLPLAPAHENEHCNDALASAKEQKESPFKILQGLNLNKN